MAWLKGLPFVTVAIALGCGPGSLDPHHAAGGNAGTDAGPDATRPDLVPVPIPPPSPPTCGNGVLDPGEQCDDGNRTSGDGCTVLCQIVCYPECGTCGPPGPCLLPVVCGDGLLASSEACDDGNTTSGDGCRSDCGTVEPGWSCAVPGRRCAPICGDRFVVGPETCDDGNTIAGDGCSEICLVEPSTAVCGDGVISGAEACDDGPANQPDTEAYGLCTTACRFGGSCGDGVVNGTEDCDLGPRMNTSSYGNPNGCGPGCRFPHFCGDGIVDEAEGEQCDLGANNGLVTEPCNTTCKILLDF